ncbi:unnamed protein product, partial [marine sediment metagenome]
FIPKNRMRKAQRNHPTQKKMPKAKKMARKTRAKFRDFGPSKA